MPLVSVVVPAYNPGRFLARSVGSVMRQGIADLECIVVDDGSEEELTAHPELQDPRVRLHRQDNRGVSVARNVGVALSDSRFVAFLDQDDEWLPGKLAQQLAALVADPRAAFSHTPFVWSLPSGERPTAPQRVTYAGSLAGEAHVCLSSVVVSRSNHDAVGGFDPLLVQQQDWDYVLKLLRVFGEPVTANRPLVRYFVHGGNASTDYAAAAAEGRSVLDRSAVDAHRRGDADALAAIGRGRRVARRLHAHQAVDRARACVRDRDVVGAARHLGRGTAMDPLVVARAVARSLGRPEART